MAQTTPILPFEILEQILGFLRPVYNSQGANFVRDDLETWQNQYFTALPFFASLRRIDRTWYHIATPLIYCTIIIKPIDETDLLRRLQFSEHHPTLIRTLVIQCVEVGLRTLHFGLGLTDRGDVLLV